MIGNIKSLLAAMAARIVMWLAAKALYSAVKSCMSDEDALAVRTRIVTEIQRRQDALKQGARFYKSQVQILRYASIIMDSGRLRAAALKANMS